MAYPKQKDPRFISTHALTWSATYAVFFIRGQKLHFNSRAHVERDF